MASQYSNSSLIFGILVQVKNALQQLEEWNASISSAEDYLLSPEGMKTLAASSMVIVAIGESVKRIDHLSKGDLLHKVPSIPWKQVMGIRDIIAHGYFDIDVDQVFDVVKNEVEPLRHAIGELVDIISDPD